MKAKKAFEKTRVCFLAIRAALLTLATVGVAAFGTLHVSQLTQGKFFWGALYGGLIALGIFFQVRCFSKYFEEKNQELDQRLDLQTRFATVGAISGNIAHDLRNPLTVLLCLLERAESSLESRIPDIDSATKGLKKAKATVERMSRIMDGLVVLARQGKDVKREQVNLGDLIRQCLELVEIKVKKEGIEIISDVPMSDLYFSGNPTQVLQVLINLINNACDAVADLPEKWIKISVRKLETQLEVVVTDSGSGFPEEIKSRLFVEAFTTKPPGKGTGLGLPLCKSLLVAHGGDIWIGEGPNTSIGLTLPILDTSSKASQNTQSIA